MNGVLLFDLTIKTMDGRYFRFLVEWFNIDEETNMPFKPIYRHNGGLWWESLLPHGTPIRWTKATAAVAPDDAFPEAK